MQKKIVKYGTKHQVTVLNSTETALVLVDKKNNEGYALIGHNLDPLPEVDDQGTIVFENMKGPQKATGSIIL